MSPDARSEVRTALGVIGGCLLAGLLVGLLWRAIAPLPHLVTRADGVFLSGGEDEVAIAADGWFAVCGATAGLVAALVVFARLRPGRLGPLLGLAFGGIAGSLVAWWLGVQLGPGPILESAKGLANGSQFDGPLKLSARGVLFAWPLTSTVAYFALVAGLEPKVAAGTGSGPAQPGSIEFPVTVLRPGYSMADVDDAFSRLDAGLLTLEEMRALRFPSARWGRGYDEMSVDAAIAAWPETLNRPNPDDESARPSLG